MTDASAEPAPGGLAALADASCWAAPFAPRRIVAERHGDVGHGRLGQERNPLPWSPGRGGLR
ncbi:hypothetical protein [Actinoplanes sp. G11-F43]|uniref:hypothetical protein n=1 Tax=Actinoplanes sp. G11-F43 TaxID=3424130 RepID=UPI003D32718A